MTDQAIQELQPLIGIKAACAVVGRSRATYDDSLFPSGQLDTKRRASIFELDVDGKVVNVPAWLMRPENQPLFDELLQQAYATGTDASRAARRIRSAEPDTSAIARAIRIWESNLSLESKDRRPIGEAAEALATRVAELDLAGRNGIWAFLLRNSYRPSLVVGNFNGVISNPPWLAMSKIGENPYKEKLQALAERYGIRPTGSAFLHMDLAPVFLTHAVNRYVTGSGRFACILPHTVLNANNYGPFRESMAPRKQHVAGLQEIWDVARGTFKDARAIAGARSALKRV